VANVTFEVFLSDHRKRLQTLYESSGAERWSVSLEEFAAAVWRGVQSASADPRELAQALTNLRAEDLALALGCMKGHEKAWEAFSWVYRSTIYESASTFTSDIVLARELTDSVVADLYGLNAQAPDRGSRFSYFHGRSSLKTWVRALVYRKFVDDYRRRKYEAPLPDELPAAGPGSGSPDEASERSYARLLGEAVTAVLGELSAPERLLLSYYYVQQLTLKQIGRITGEHEATVSRHLEALRKKVRTQIEAYLKNIKKLSNYDRERCLDFASRGVDVDLERVLKID
jgi:RNA polymerase sigma-70 factor